MLTIRTLVQSIATGIASVFFASAPIHAEQPIRLEAGFPPGGTTDVIARLLAQKLSEKLGRSIIVENRAGASGNIAATFVTRAEPDGNTLLLASSTHAANASLYQHLEFDTLKDFAAIGLVAKTPYVLVVHPSLPVQDVAQLIAYLMQFPGKIAFASSSPGSPQHLAAELFKKETKVDILHVPYKGSAAALPDLMAGRVSMMFDNLVVMMPYLKKGVLRPLAITATHRSSLLPDLPTVAESGLPGYDVEGWFAVLAPAKTPRKVIIDLNRALEAVVNGAAFSERLAELGAEKAYSTPDAADTLIQEEVIKWRAVIRDANITVQ